MGQKRPARGREELVESTRRGCGNKRRVFAFKIVSETRLQGSQDLLSHREYSRGSLSERRLGVMVDEAGKGRVAQRIYQDKVMSIVRSREEQWLQSVGRQERQLLVFKLGTQGLQSGISLGTSSGCSGVSVRRADDMTWHTELQTDDDCKASCALTGRCLAPPDLVQSSSFGASAHKWGKSVCVNQSSVEPTVQGCRLTREMNRTERSQISEPAVLVCWIYGKEFVGPRKELHIPAMDQVEWPCGVRWKVELRDCDEQT